MKSITIEFEAKNTARECARDARCVEGVSVRPGNHRTVRLVIDDCNSRLAHKQLGELLAHYAGVYEGIETNVIALNFMNKRTVRKVRAALSKMDRVTVLTWDDRKVVVEYYTGEYHVLFEMFAKISAMGITLSEMTVVGH